MKRAAAAALAVALAATAAGLAAKPKRQQAPVPETFAEGEQEGASVPAAARIRVAEASDVPAAGAVADSGPASGHMAASGAEAGAMLPASVTASETAMAGVGAASAGVPGPVTPGAVIAPPGHRRGIEQTYLTFPEWFLVHSPAEYAAYVRHHTPSDFPFFGHVRQFWSSYRDVYEETKRYPFNGGYHVMIMVIGVSTTIEYGLRSAYENVIGRLSELTMTHGQTEEDRFGAKVAQEYVDFIRELPWYEFDFWKRLKGLWSGTTLTGDDMIRKWERKFALTTEYAIKGVYGYLIKLGTKASYEEPLMVTTVVLDRMPDSLPNLKLLQKFDDGSVLVAFPRYQAFSPLAQMAVLQGVEFREIAGNHDDLLVSVLAPTAWQARVGGRVLFEQDVITQPGRKRVAIIVKVPALASALKAIDHDGAELEHIYDY